MFPESPEFARSFAIYSDNPAIAHQLVTTDFKHRLLTFHRRIEKPVYLSFIDDKLYLAISVNKDLFEPTMAQSVLNFELIKASFEYMRISTEIVEMVKDAQLNKPSLPKYVPPKAKLTPYEQFRRFYEINLFTKLLRLKRQNPPKIDKLNFKKDIISSIVTFVDDKFTFEPEKQIPLEELKASGLWKNYHQLGGEDYIQGTLEHTEMKCFKVHTLGSKKTSKGLFFIFNFNLSFEGVTVVLPRRQLFRKKSLTWGGTELNLINLADSEFERQLKTPKSLLSNRSVLITGC
ncbi:Galanin, partial [Candidatus Thiomargarita nelsonii]